MRTIKPMLAKDSQILPGTDYYWERKFDGIRIIAFVSGKEVYLQARSGTNKTDTFPELRIETTRPAILDGEVISSLGTFSAIQRRVNRVYDIDLAAKYMPTQYCIFDVLEIDGKNMEDEPLKFRKEALSEILVPTDNAQLVEFTSDAPTLWNTAMENHWEGIMGKPIDSVYTQGKRRWIKTKIFQEGEFLAVGYTEGTGKRLSSFGALILTKGDKYVGQVGTGFDDYEIDLLMKDMKVCESPFLVNPCKFTPVLPFLVKVKFLEYTEDGILRFPAYKERV